MRVKLCEVPWKVPALTDEAKEAMEIIGENIWKDASMEFHSVQNLKIKTGKSILKGMQRYLNKFLDERFNDYGWYGNAGYFVKKQTWIRITFRHQMSLGSDILEAIKACKKDGMELAIILAASRKTLDLISPKDAPAMISFEKLQKEVMSLEGVLDIPLIIGELSSTTVLSDCKNVE
mgnify:CR=1 FL=1